MITMDIAVLYILCSRPINLKVFLTDSDFTQALGFTICAKTLPFRGVEMESGSQTLARVHSCYPRWTALGTDLGSFCGGLVQDGRIRVVIPK